MGDCIKCVNNSGIEGQPEYGKAWKRANNTGCSCSCGSTEGEVTEQQDDRNRTVTTARLVRERPTSDPSVWLVVKPLDDE